MPIAHEGEIWGVWCSWSGGSHLVPNLLSRNMWLMVQNLFSSFFKCFFRCVPEHLLLLMFVGLFSIYMYIPFVQYSNSSFVVPVIPGAVHKDDRIQAPRPETRMIWET